MKHQTPIEEKTSETEKQYNKMDYKTPIEEKTSETAKQHNKMDYKTQNTNRGKTK